MSKNIKKLCQILLQGNEEYRDTMSSLNELYKKGKSNTESYKKLTYKVNFLDGKMQGIEIALSAFTEWEYTYSAQNVVDDILVNGKSFKATIR